MSQTWQVVLKPDETLRKASRSNSTQAFGYKISDPTPPEDVVKGATAHWQLPSSKQLTFYESDRDSDGGSMRVGVNLGSLVAAVSSGKAAAAGRVNSDKCRVTLNASVGTKASGKPSHRQTRREEPWRSSMRSAMDKYCSRYLDFGAFHLKQGEPKAWPLGVEATVATVKLADPEANLATVRAAITQ